VFGGRVFQQTFSILVEETGVPGGNHRPAASHWQTLSFNVVSSTSSIYRNLKLKDRPNLFSFFPGVAPAWCASNKNIVISGLKADHH
jgi:hypothetical protein